MPRIFDNIEQDLLPALQQPLEIADHADFCVGYFNLRGWKQLHRFVERWPGGDGNCCRLLVVHEHDCIVLTQDVPDEGLQAGDVGTVVHIHQGGAAYEVEFMTLTGQTVAVATVLPSQLRPVSSRDVSHVRELAAR